MVFFFRFRHSIKNYSAADHAKYSSTTDRVIEKADHLRDILNAAKITLDKNIKVYEEMTLKCNIEFASKELSEITRGFLEEGEAEFSGRDIVEQFFKYEKLYPGRTKRNLKRMDYTGMIRLRPRPKDNWLKLVNEREPHERVLLLDSVNQVGLTKKVQSKVTENVNQNSGTKIVAFNQNDKRLNLADLDQNVPADNAQDNKLQNYDPNDLNLSLDSATFEALHKERHGFDLDKADKLKEDLLRIVDDLSGLADEIQAEEERTNVEGCANTPSKESFAKPRATSSPKKAKDQGKSHGNADKDAVRSASPIPKEEANPILSQDHPYPILNIFRIKKIKLGASSSIEKVHGRPPTPA